MTSSGPAPHSPDREAAPTQGIPARMLASCLVAVEDFLEDAVEQACRAHPEHAEAIRARMREVRAAGLAARVKRRPSESGSWQGTPSLASADETESFEPIGPYHPLKELGRGGQALVYLAEDLRLHRPVALKILRGFGPISEDVMRRFRREAEVASKLDHPGICAVFDAGVERGIPYIAMRYVEGESLAAKIAAARSNGAPVSARSFVEVTNGEPTEVESTPPTEATTLPTGQNTRVELMRVVRMIEKAARALHIAHEAGIVHRDVKPGNILVTPAAEPVLLDFGLAGDVAGEFSAFTRTGELFGTPAYMSPEQLLAKRIRLDRRTDVYSLGATLYECVALRRPFEAPTREALYRAIQFRDPPNVRKLNPLVPTDLKVVLDKALEKDRDRRYPTAEAFADDLQRVRKGEPIAARPVSRTGRVLRWAKRRPYSAALVLTLLIGLPLVTGLGAYVITKLPDYGAAWDRAHAEEIERLLEHGFNELAEHEDDTAYDRAIESFDHALSKQPGRVEAVAGKVLAFYSKKECESCVHELDARPALERQFPSLQRVRAYVLYKLGQRTQAEVLESRIAEPGTELDQFLAGLTLMRDCGQQDDHAVFRRAVDRLTKAVLASRRLRPMYLLELAHAIGHLHDEGGARMICRVLQTTCPQSSEAWFRVGCAWHRIDDDRAILAYRRDLELQPNASGTSRNLAQLLSDRGQFDDAIAVLKRAIQLAPSTAGLQAHLCAVLARAGRMEEALVACEQTLQLQPDDWRTYHTLGEVLLHRLDHIDEAIDLLREAIKLDPSRIEPRSVLVHAYEMKGDIEAAILEAHEAIENAPDRAAGYGTLGRLLCDRKKLFKEAAQFFMEAIRRAPEVPHYRANLGQAFLNQKRYAAAIEACRDAVALDPAHAHAHKVWGQALLGTENPECLSEAIEHLEKAIRCYARAEDFETGVRKDELKYPLALSHNALGNALSRTGDTAALEHYREAVRLAPGNASFHYNLAVAWRRLGDADRAIWALEKALQLDADLAEAHYVLGCVLQRRKGDYVRAVDHLQAAVRLQPDRSLFWWNLAIAFESAGRFGDAAHAHRKALDLGHDPVEALVALATMLIAAGDAEQAIEAAKKAVSLDATSAAAHAVLARGRGAVGDREGELEASRAAAQLSPESPPMPCNLGACLSERGWFDRAQHEYARAIRLFAAQLTPSDEESIPWSNLASSYHDVGRLDDARHAFEYALTLRHPPGFGGLYLAFGSLLQDLGCFRDALVMIHKGYDLGPYLLMGRPWRVPPRQRIRIAERLIKLEERTDAVLRGEWTPDTAEDWALLAVILRARRDYAGAVRFFADALARDDASVAAPIKRFRRYHVDAARSAALAGAGQGTSGAGLTLTERAEFRRQALAWLEEELTYLVEDVIPPRDALDGTQFGRYEVLRELRRWEVHVDFTSVRDVEGLAQLPAAERDAWIAFWQRVEAVVATLDEK